MKVFGPYRRLVAGIALSVALAWVSLVGVSAAITRAPLRPAAPDFQLGDSQGLPVELSSYRSKVVIVDFWATWCTGCKVEIPWFMEFEKKYKNAGLETIGVAMDAEGWDKVSPYLEQHPFNYRIVVGDDRFAKLFNVSSLPMTLLIDRDGRIAEQHVGMVDKDVWEKEVLTLLHEKPNSPTQRRRPGRLGSGPADDLYQLKL